MTFQEERPARTVYYCELCGDAFDEPIIVDTEDESAIVCTPCFNDAKEEV